MSDTKVTREGLPIDNVTRHTPIEEVHQAIGETAKQLREKEGLHPLVAFRESHRRANDRMNGKLPDIDMRGVR